MSEEPEFIRHCYAMMKRIDEDAYQQKKRYVDEIVRWQSVNVAPSAYWYVEDGIIKPNIFVQNQT